jgi:hypothetical protein
MNILQNFVGSSSESFANHHHFLMMNSIYMNSGKLNSLENQHYQQDTLSQINQSNNANMNANFSQYYEPLTQKSEKNQQSNSASNLNFFPMIENKRIRNMFNTKQIQVLEKIFEQTHYPDSTMREQLSMSLNLDIIRIQVWFQNRRAKYKKMDSSQSLKFSSSSSKSRDSLDAFNKKLTLLSM